MATLTLALLGSLSGLPGGTGLSGPAVRAHPSSGPADLPGLPGLSGWSGPGVQLPAPARAAAPEAGGPGPGLGPEAPAVQALVQRLAHRGLEHVDLRLLEELYAQVDPGLRWLAVNPVRFVGSLGREGVPEPGQVLQAAGDLFVRELRVNVRLLARVLALAALGAVLNQLGRGLGARGAQEVAGAAIVLSLALLALQSFLVAARMVSDAVAQMAGVAQALLPTLTALAASTGSAWTAAALHPVLLGVVSLAADVVRRVVVPGLLVGCALGLAGSLSSEFPMARLASLAQRVSLTVLGLCLTAFLGVVSVKGAFAPVADGVALRTVKFLTGSTVPVVGRMMAEAVEVVASASTLIRVGVGAAGMTLVLLLAAAPALKLLAVMAVFSLSAALLEPVGERRVQAALGVLGETLGLLLAALAACTVLYLVALSALAGVARPLGG